MLVHVFMLPASEQPCRTKDCVTRIPPRLILGSITDEELSICKGHITGSDSVPLIIWYHLYFTVPEDTHAGITGANVNSNAVH